MQRECESAYVDSWRHIGRGWHSFDPAISMAQTDHGMRCHDDLQVFVALLSRSVTESAAVCLVNGRWSTFQFALDHDERLATGRPVPYS